MLAPAVLAVTALAAMCAGQDASGSRGKVTSVQFWSLGEVTRIAVEVSSEFTFKYFRLTDPERLAFDIYGATPAMVTRGVHSIPVADALLDQIRVAEKEPGVTRVVLDLPRQTEMTSSLLANPNRLVMELRAKGRMTPRDAGSVTGGKALTESRDGPAPVERPVVSAHERRVVDEEDAHTVRHRAPARPFVPPHIARKPVLIAAVAPPQIRLPATSVPAAMMNAAAVSAWLPAPGKAPEKTSEKAPEAGVVARAQRNETEGVRSSAAAVAAKVPRAAAPIAEPGQPEAAKRSAISGDRSLTRALGLKLGRVVLDPGHGGNDQGTHGPSGYLEKELALDVALRLGEMVHERLGSEVVYTRSEDIFVPLEERTRIANERRADLFLSIHANSSSYRAAAGTETYVLNFTTSKTAMDLAARENASSERSIFDLQELLQRIALKDKVDESREFAVRLQTALASLSGRVNERAKDRGVKKAPFVVLIGAAMPSVLAEIGFLSNAADEKLLRTPDHRQRLAEALFKGIASYADTLSHFQAAGKPVAGETLAGFAAR